MCCSRSAHWAYLFTRHPQPIAVCLAPQNNLFITCPVSIRYLFGGHRTPPLPPYPVLVALRSLILTLSFARRHVYRNPVFRRLLCVMCTFFLPRYPHPIAVRWVMRNTFFMTCLDSIPCSFFFHVYLVLVLTHPNQSSLCCRICS